MGINHQNSLPVILLQNIIPISFLYPKSYIVIVIKIIDEWHELFTPFSFTSNFINIT